MNSKGFALSELLIALFLGSVLSALAVSVFLQNVRSQADRSMQQNMMQDAQLALDILQFELRMAGFSAHQIVQVESTAICSGNYQWIMDVNHGLDLAVNAQESLRGTKLNGNCLTLKPVANTDVLIIRRLGNQAKAFNETLAEAWYFLQKNNPEESRFVYLSAWPNDGTITLDDKLWAVESRIFYVRGYSVQGDNIPSLIMVTPTKTGFQQQVLIENVEALQFEWVIQQENSYQVIRKPTLEQLNHASLARIFLLMRYGGKQVQDSDQTPFLLAENQAFPVADSQYWHRLLVSSVKLRNRGME